MRRMIRLFLAGATLASVSFVPAPSSACYGEICDAICLVTTTWNGTPVGKKFPFTSCPM